MKKATAWIALVVFSCIAVLLLSTTTQYQFAVSVTQYTSITSPAFRRTESTLRISSSKGQEASRSSSVASSFLSTKKNGNGDQGGGECDKKSSSFQPLHNFTFWGKSMNIQSPCPTAGMNNQLSLLISLLYCATTSPRYFKTPGVFKWKDISCSPTGGKEGKGHHRFAIGGEDYEYAWFRWSEFFQIAPMTTEGSETEKRGSPIVPFPLPPSGVKPVRLCFADNYSWSENGPSMRKCPTKIDAAYGTPQYWYARSLLPLSPLHEALVDHLLLLHLKKKFKELHQDMNPSRRKTLKELLTEDFHVVAIHIRRGDYEHFCRDTAKSSGVKKFKIAAYKYIQKARGKGKSSSITFGRRFMENCFPSLDNVINNVRTVIEKRSKEEVHSPSFPQGKKKSKPVVLFVATNSKMFLDELHERFQQKQKANHNNNDADGMVQDVITLNSLLKNAMLLGDDKNGNSDPDGEELFRRHFQSYVDATKHRSQYQPVRDIDEQKNEKPFLHQNVEGTSEETIGFHSLSSTQKAILDVAILSKANDVVLNLYSTFSQSVIDFRMLREGTLDGMGIHWW